MIRKFHIVLGVAMLIAMFTAMPAMLFVAKASVPGMATADAKCSAPNSLARLDHVLSRTMRRIAAGLPITVVALGSSSTAGAGASEPQNSYPSRLAADLQEQFPGHPIKVINRGANGEEAADMVARLDADVLSEKPDLVVWQVGTNGLLRDYDFNEIRASVEAGVTRLKAAGSDVVMMDLQLAPSVVAKAEHKDMVSLIANVAKKQNVNVFRRFAVMKNWHEEQKIPYETFVTQDALHMNDWGYGCVAKILAGSLADAATRPVVTAGNYPI
jgi:lysophospholipase L1-like esterase